MRIFSLPRASRQHFDIPRDGGHHFADTALSPERVEAHGSSARLAALRSSRHSEFRSTKGRSGPIGKNSFNIGLPDTLMRNARIKIS